MQVRDKEKKLRNPAEKRGAECENNAATFCRQDFIQQSFRHCSRMTSFAALRHNKVMRKIENGDTSRQKHCRLRRNKTLLLDNADETLSKTSQCIAESYDMLCKKETETGPERRRERQRDRNREKKKKKGALLLQSGHR
jgi:hypothetical protein